MTNLETHTPNEHDVKLIEKKSFSFEMEILDLKKKLSKI